LGREKLERNIQFLLLGLKRNEKERRLKSGTHEFSISLQGSEERAEKVVFSSI
jgi:hypothetical protein